MADEVSPNTVRPAGEAFLVDPPGGSSRWGVLVLHSWWGLNHWTQNFCRRVAKLGYTVVAPDLFDGVQPVTETEGKAVLEASNPDELSGLVISSAHALRTMTTNRTNPIAVIGFSMGASLGFWISARLPEVIDRTISFYGTQSIDFDNAKAKFQGHFGDDDHLVSEEDRVVTESFLRLGGQETEFFVYPGAKQWFFEEGPNFDEQNAELAWSRMVSFLDRNQSSLTNDVTIEQSADPSPIFEEE